VITGDAARARGYYEEVRKLANEANLPEFTSLIYIFEKTRECDYDAAIRRAEKVLTDAHEAAFYLNIACATAHMFKIEYGKAAKYVEAAVEIDAEHFRIDYARAQLDFVNEELDSSLQSFKRAMEKEPGLPSSYIGIANVYFAQKDYNKALGYFERALEIAEDIPHTHCGLARMMMSRRNYATAERHIQRALELDAENPYVSSVAASFYYETGRLDIALEITGKAVERCPDDRYVRLNLGGYLYSAGRNEEALEQAEKALQLGAEPAQELIDNIKGTLGENVKPRFIDAGERMPHKE
jgi:tetratricopeptide (TPR) repeat protein